MVAPMFILIPLYIYPAGTAWQPLISSIAANPSIPFKIVINPNNGPGSGSLPDSNYMNGIATLNSYSNVDLYGYVYSSYGLRWASSIEADILAYSNWAASNASLAMDGIFLDQSPSSDIYHNYVSIISQYTASLFGNGTSTGMYLNPGSTVATDFYSLADYINVYENTQLVWDMYEGFDVSYIPCAVRSQSSVIIYDYIASNTQLANDALALGNSGTAGAYITANDGLFGAITSSFQSLLNVGINALAQVNVTERANPCVIYPGLSSTIASVLTASATTTYGVSSTSTSAFSLIAATSSASAAAASSSTSASSSAAAVAASSSTPVSSSVAAVATSTSSKASTLSTITTTSATLNPSSTSATSAAKTTSTACSFFGIPVACF